MVKGASGYSMSKDIVVKETSNTTKKGSRHTAASVTHTGITTVVLHCTALYNDEKLHKLQYIELQGGHIPESY